MVVTDPNIIFIHIPRTGGTSIETAFGQPVYDHLLPYQVIDKIGINQWNNSFKFSIVRNPWDRMVSIFHFRNKINHIPRHVTFKEWLIELKDNNFKIFNGHKMAETGQLKWISDNGKILMDHIGRFENLKQEWKFICEKTGINLKLPHVNSTSHNHYSTYYDNETKTIVSDRCAEDIDFFGYKFKSPRGIGLI